MPSGDRSGARRARRDSCRRRRRVQKFIGLLRQSQADIENIKERRPPATSIDKVIQLTETGLALSDSISTSTTTNPTVNYDDPDRGYGYAEYRSR